jgi:thiol-disulfide isomerase/thioredoxin
MKLFCNLSLNAGAAALALVLLASPASAQPEPKNESKPVPAPRVVRVDDAGLRDVLTAKDRPRVVNFWATWCAPCIEEFPDLVKIAEDYKDRVEVVTVSLDDVADIDTLVPDFLKRMNASMPAFLLVSADESALISAVQKDWSGGLPFTVIYVAGGAKAYFKEGKFKPADLRAEIDKTLANGKK